ncbi:MAG: M3 family oligoendopeptidase [bacterium]|nr:M3 family oligoendopeptidase [bacterium]
MKTEWNLKLLYSSGNDQKIEEDIMVYEKAIESFEKKYRKSKDYLTNEDSLLKALTEYEEISGMNEGSKAAEYFYFRKDLNSTDQEAEAKLNQLSDRLTKVGNKIIFFDLDLAKIDKKLQKQFLKSSTLKHFHYFLHRIFLTAEHNLSEAEEKIVNLKSLPSNALWIQGQEKLLTQQTVKFKGNDLPLPEAFNKLSILPTIERRKLNDDINAVLKNISYFAESEINAVFINKKINDELFKFKNPYSKTILGYQNNEESIINFVNTVTKSFSIAHRFYKIKAKMLGVDKLEYADRAAKVGEIKVKPTFEESYNILETAFAKAGPRYVNILKDYVKNGQIDVYPKKGKRGGAYCAGSIGLPTYVLLNHVDTLDSLKTFAHEMGHAIHTEFSKGQTPIYQRYTISAAEVASTLFENFAFDEIFPRLSDKEKIIALHDRINDGIATIFRQIACFNYELELHQEIRTQGALSKEEMANLHNKHMKAYLGPLFTMKENDGYFFVQWPHIRYGFYVYSYAYGEIISSALYKRYKENPKYMEEIEKFLSAGGSKSPEDIFKNIGIDTSKPEFFVEGLKAIEDDIKKLEKLIR